MRCSHRIAGFDFDARAGSGVLVLSYDKGGKGEPSDYEIRVNRYNSVTRFWSGASALTNDNSYDANPSVLVTSSDDTYIAWTRDGDLVVDKNFQNRPRVIRRGSDETEISEVHLRDLTHGRISATWTENTLRGASVITMIYDPATRTWSSNSLCPGLPMESVFDVVSDRAGNLVPIFTETAIDLQTVRAPAENGKTVVVEEVPLPDEQSIKIGKFRPTSHVLLRNLTTDALQITPGQAIKLSARVADNGLLGVRNMAVTFFEGDPEAGGRFLARRNTGPIRGGASAAVTLSYVVPTPLRDTAIYAVLETGRTKVLHLSGRLLTATELNSVVRPDGSGVVEALIANDGAPSVGSFQVNLVNRANGRIVTFATVTRIPAGEIYPIRFTLPVGAVQPGGSDFKIQISRNRIRGPVIDTFGDNVHVERPGRK